MAVMTEARKPLGVRATPEQHRILTDAAAKTNRSVSSFVLSAALDAAAAQVTGHRRSLEEVRAIVEAARQQIRQQSPRIGDLSEELISERRAEAARE